MVAARAAQLGVSPWQVLLDLLARGDGDTLLLYPFENYSSGSLNEIFEMLTDPTPYGGRGCRRSCGNDM